MPKRAILYVCWGQPFINEAVASAHSAAFLGVDRVLITDNNSLQFLPPHPPFEKAFSYTFSLPGLGGKAEMLQFLPPDYDSFLFLDTDTRVMADVSFGFERAEAHGIAIAMAPAYSLEHFAEFSLILNLVGYPYTDTLQYNSGVIFLTKRPDVLKVLQRWQELCSGVGARSPLLNDQPFFTLAMEMERFNPYTLSRAYNYRNAGEPAYGVVRIWHSRYAPPADVNFFHSHQPRAWKDSVRVTCP